MWEGDWFGSWEGSWFGQSDIVVASMSANLAGSATLTATITAIDIAAVLDGAIQIPSRMTVGCDIEESMLVGLQFAASMSYHYESSGHWMSLALTVGQSMEQWVTPIGMPMGENDDVFELEVEMDVSVFISPSMNADAAISKSMSNEGIGITPSMATSLTAGMSMAGEYNITTPLIMG